MAIRYDSGLNSEIHNLVKRFNAKRARLRGLELPELPERLTTAEIKASVSNRKQLRSLLSRYELFLKRGAEQAVPSALGSPISRYNLAILKRDISTLKAQITRRRHAVEAEYAGRFMPPVLSSELKALERRYQILSTPQPKWTPSIYRTVQRERYVKRNLEELQQRFRQNFLDIFTKMGGMIDLPVDQFTEQVINKIQSMNAAELYEAVKRDPNLRSLLDYYKAVRLDVAEVDITPDMLIDAGNALLNL